MGGSSKALGLELRSGGGPGECVRRAEHGQHEGSPSPNYPAGSGAWGSAAFQEAG